MSWIYYQSQVCFACDGNWWAIFPFPYLNPKNLSWSVQLGEEWWSGFGAIWPPVRVNTPHLVLPKLCDCINHCSIALIFLFYSMNYFHQVDTPESQRLRNRSREEVWIQSLWFWLRVVFIFTGFVISLSKSRVTVTEWQSNHPPPSVANPDLSVKTDRHILVIRLYFSQSSFYSERNLQSETS